MRDVVLPYLRMEEMQWLRRLLGGGWPYILATGIKLIDLSAFHDIRVVAYQTNHLFNLDRKRFGDGAITYNAWLRRML